MLPDPQSTSAIATDFPRIFGDFTLQAELGRGGSGVVYAALWGHREIALKVLHPDQTATEKFRDQFLVEARRLSELTHPGVVKVLAVGVVDDRPYLAMERLHGETLAERLTRGALPIALAMDVAQQLAAAVAAMHARNLVHRDLKPENVFLVDAQHAILLDFGIAKDLFSAPSTTTQDGGIRGTPAYMAPERFFGQAAGVATDVYELAVVVYAMIAARLPWDSLTDPSARLDPKPLIEAPPAVDTFLHMAMSTRAANRPASVTDFAAQLRANAGDDELPPHETQPLPAQTYDAAIEKSATPTASALAYGTTLPLLPTTAAAPTAGAWFTRVTTTAKTRASEIGEAGAPAGVRDATLAARPQTGVDSAAQSELVAQAVPARRTSSNQRQIFAGAIALAAVLGAGIVWWKFRDRPSTAYSAPRFLPEAAMLAVANDPWHVDGTAARGAREDVSGGANTAGLMATTGGRQSQPGETGEVEAKNAAADAADVVLAADIATAITRIPHGSSIIATASLLGWRRNPDGLHVIEVALAKPTVAAIVEAVPPCVRELIRDARWLVFSAKSRELTDGYTVQLGGIDSAQAAQACLAGDGKDERIDGRTRATWAGLLEGTLLWRDQTLVFSSYRNITAAQVYAGGRDFGLMGRSRELYARVLPGAAVALVVDLPADTLIDGLPRGTDVVASLALPVGKVVVDASAETGNLADAQALEASGSKQLATMLGAVNELINIAVSRDGNVVRLHGKLPPMILQVVARALADTK